VCSSDLTDLGPVGDPGAAIHTVVITSNSIANFSADDISFTQDSITINLSAGGAGEAVLSLNPVVVPLPGAIWLFGSTLIGSGSVRERRSSTHGAT